MVPFAAKGPWGHEEAIGFQDDPVQGDGGGGFYRFAGIVEVQNAEKTDVSAQIYQLLGHFRRRSAHMDVAQDHHYNDDCKRCKLAKNILHLGDPFFLFVEINPQFMSILLLHIC